MGAEPCRSDECLITQEYEVSGVDRDIYGRLMSPGGVLTPTSPITIAIGGNDQPTPDVAYLAVWREKSGGVSDIKEHLVDPVTGAKNGVQSHSLP